MEGALRNRCFTGQAIIRHHASLGSHQAAELLFSKRLARLSNRGAYLVHTFPSPTGDRKGIGHARDPDPFGMVRHPLPFLSVPLAGNAATASAGSASDLFHSLADQLPTIFLGGQTAAHRRQVLSVKGTLLRRSRGISMKRGVQWRASLRLQSTHQRVMLGIPMSASQRVNRGFHRLSAAVALIVLDARFGARYVGCAGELQVESDRGVWT